MKKHKKFFGKTQKTERSFRIPAGAAELTDEKDWRIVTHVVERTKVFGDEKSSDAFFVLCDSLVKQKRSVRMRRSAFYFPVKQAYEEDLL